MPEPRLEIVVQPKTHGQRFRYKCESRSAGCLIGEGSCNETMKVYPTVEVSYSEHLSLISVNDVALLILQFVISALVVFCIFPFTNIDSSIGSH